MLSQRCRTDVGPETVSTDTAMAAVQGSGRPSRWRPSMWWARKWSLRRRTCASWTSREHRQARLALLPVAGIRHPSPQHGWHERCCTPDTGRELCAGGLCCALLPATQCTDAFSCRPIYHTGLCMSIGATCFCCRHTGQIQSSQAVCACRSAGCGPSGRRCLSGQSLPGSPVVLRYSHDLTQHIDHPGYTLAY